MRRISLRLLGVTLLFLLVSANSVSAQQFATLNVTVNDQSGGAVVGTNLTLKNTATGVERTAVTGESGLAVIPSVPAGSYGLTATHAGFAAHTITVQLAVGQIASVTVSLGVSAKAETVEVTETAQAVDPEKAEVSQVIDTPKIKDLPISGRDFIDFVLLTPSVSVGRSTAVGAQSPFTETVLKLSFGGVRESHTSFYSLDGIDYNTSISGVQRISPSQDWVQEFRVVSSPFTGDNGRNLGSVVNTVTKSGTNDVHGTLYEFFRNNKLAEDNLLSAPGFNTLRFNQFGGTVGGPIRKDKLFLFAGYEGQRRAESPIYSQLILNTIDTDGILGPGSLSINHVKELLGLQPEALNSILSIDDYDKLIVKANAILSNKTFLNLTYLFNDSRKQNVRGAAPGQGLPSSFRDNPVRDQTPYGSLVHIFSQALTSETLFQYGRRKFDLIPKGAGLEPAINIPDVLSSGGFIGSVRTYTEQRIQAAENLTYVRGNHTFKVGGDIEPVWIDTQVTLFSPGAGLFSPGSFFGGPGQLPPGTALVFAFLEPREKFGQQLPQRTLPFSTGLYAGPLQQSFDDATTLKFEHSLWSLYAQDHWKVRPNLTVTLGLRYDVDTFPSAADVKIQGKFHPTYYGNIQPRASLAYSFHNGKGVVRAGAGLFDSAFVFSDVLVSWIGASEFTYMNQPLLSEFSDPTNQLIGFGASGVVGAPGPVFGGGGFSNFTHFGIYPDPTTSPVLQFPLGYAKLNFKNPFSEQASLEIEHQVGKDFFVSLGYQWLHASRLPVYFSINGTPIPGCDPTSGCLPYFTPADHNFGFVLYVKPEGFSIYNAGTLSVRKSFSHHYDFLANYTYSKSMDIATTVNLPNTPVNFLHPNWDKAPGDNDIPHRLTLALLAETPSTWNLMLRDFKASVLTNLQSARRYSIVAGFDTNGDIFPFGDRVGVIGRNTYKGDPSHTVDLRIQRGIPLNERIKLELSAEIFNLLNRANVLQIDSTYGLPVFVTPVPTHFGDGIAPSIPSGGNPSFGSPQFAAPARQVQLSLRLNF